MCSCVWYILLSRWVLMPVISVEIKEILLQILRTPQNRIGSQLMPQQQGVSAITISNIAQMVFRIKEQDTLSVVLYLFSINLQTYQLDAIIF